MSRTFDLSISGMHCVSCSSKVEKALVGLDGVDEAGVNFATGRATLTVARDPDTQKVVETVNNAGYEVALSKLKVRLPDISCASCIGTVEKTLKRLTGVTNVNVNLATKLAEVDFIDGMVDAQAISELLNEIGYPPEMVEHEKDAATPDDINLNDYRQSIRRFLFAASGAVIVVPLSHIDILPEQSARFVMLFAALAVFLTAGRVFFVRAYKALRHWTADMNTLIALGSGTAFVYSAAVTIMYGRQSAISASPAVYFDTAIIILAFILLGNALEAKAKAKASSAVTSLIKLKPKSALVLQEGSETSIPIDRVVVDDLIRVHASESVPTDGIVIEGSSSIDESMMTGESMPVDKSEGDRLYGGTINTTGSFIMRATRVGSDTALAGIIRLVEQAQGSKAPIQRLADKIASVFVPVVVIIAVISFILWMIFGGDPRLPAALNAFISVLIIACPCAMGLATPTAILVGSGSAARHGVVFKGGDVIETTAKLGALFVDKTGTVTEGKPEVVKIVSFAGTTEEEALRIAASVEVGSQHPLAEAVTTAAKNRSLTLSEAEDFQQIAGSGVSARIDGSEIIIGSVNWLQGQEVEIVSQTMESLDELHDMGLSILGVAKDGKLIGIMGLADQIRSTSQQAIESISSLGIHSTLLTGDKSTAATRIGSSIGFNKIISEVLPEDKSRIIEQRQDEMDIVGMVGDGVNDAPALAQADVGFAIGSGSDVAVEAGDVILVGSELTGVAFAIRHARRTVSIIKQNLFWAFFYNSLGIPIAAGLFYPFTGWLLPPVFAAAAMALSSVSVVTNSLRLRFTNYR